MPASERLSLLIESRTTGEQDIARLEQAINKVVSASEKAGNSVGGIGATQSAQIQKFGELVKTSMVDPLGAVETAAAGAAGSLGPVGAGVLALIGTASAATAAFLSMATSVGDAAEATLNFSARTGLTTKEVTQFTSAARLAGVDAGAFETIMKSLGAALGDTGEDGKKAREAMAELKVQLYDTKGVILPTSQLLINLSSAIASVEDPLKRVHYATDIFKKKGLELIPVLMELKSSVGELGQQGLGFGEKTLSQLDATSDTLKKISGIWENLLLKSKIDLILTLKPQVDWAYDAAKRLNKGGAGSSDFFGAAMGLVSPALLGLSVDRMFDLYGAYQKGADPSASSFGMRMPEMGAFGATASVPDQAARINAFPGRTSGNNTLDLERDQTKTKQDLEKARLDYGSLKSTPGVLPGTLDAAEKNINKLAASYTNLGDQIKAAKREEEERQKVFEAIDDSKRQRSLNRIIDETGNFATASGGRVLGNLNESDLTPSMKKYLDMSMKSPGSMDALGKSLLPLSDREFGTGQIQKTLDMFEKADRELKERWRDDIVKMTDESNAITDKIASGNLESFKGIRSASFDRQLTSTQQYGNYAAQFSAVLNSGPGQEQQAIRSELQLRKDLAQQIAGIEKARVDYLMQFEPEATRNAKTQLEYTKIRGDLEKETLQAQLDASLKLQQLEKQREESLRATGEQFTRALFGGRDGISAFFKNEIQGIGSKIGGNAFATFGKSAAGALSIPGQQNADGSPNLIGKLLAGTPFGIDPLKGATDLNTIATNANTAAILQFIAVAVGAAGGAGAGVGGLGAGTDVGNMFGAGGIFGSDTNGLTGRGGFAGAAGGTGSLGILNKLFGRNSSAAFGNFGVGLGATASGGLPSVWGAITGNQEQLGKDGTWGPVSSATRVGEIAGAAAAAIPAALGIYSGIKQGGVGGFAKAGASALGLAAAFDPEPISKAILGIAALGTTIIGAVFGQNPQKRGAQISKYLDQAHFNAPVSQSVTSDIAGTYVDYGANGMLRGSNLSPYPTVQQPYTQRYDGGFFGVPGQTTSPGGGNIVINVQAMDAKSIVDRGADIANAVHSAIRGGQANTLVNTLQNRL